MNFSLLRLDNQSAESLDTTLQRVHGDLAIFAPKKKNKNPKGTLAYKLPPRFKRETGELTTLAEYVSMVTSFEVKVYHEKESTEFILQLFFFILITAQCYFIQHLLQEI